MKKILLIAPNISIILGISYAPMVGCIGNPLPEITQ